MFYLVKCPDVLSSVHIAWTHAVLHAVNQHSLAECELWEQTCCALLTTVSPASRSSLTRNVCSTTDIGWMREISSLVFRDWLILFPPILLRSLLLTLLSFLVQFVQLFTKFCPISLLFLNSLSNQAVVLMHVTLMLRSLESGALAQASSKIPDGHFHALSARPISKFYQHLRVGMSEKACHLS